MNTKLLYLESNVLKASAKIISVGTDELGQWIETDRTPLHCRGGGQLSDKGTIGEHPVLDVRNIDDQIRHYLETHSFSVGDSVHINVDEDERNINSMWHSAGHLVASIAESLHPFHVDRAHQYPGEAWVAGNTDVSPCDNLLDKINIIISQMIDKKLPITTRSGSSRLVTIDGYGSVPCGGTHVTTTESLKGLKVTKKSFKKNMLRLSYSIESS